MLTHTNCKNSFLLVLMICMTSMLHAANSDIIFQRLTINDGLSLSSVYCVFQDSKGFMWFATEDGLNKYDGEKFTIYNHTPGAQNSLSNKWVESILEDKQGMIWLGTRHGLSRLDPTTDRITSYLAENSSSNSLANDTVVCLALNGDFLWVGSRSGLNRIHTETLKSEEFLLENELSPGSVNTIYVDSRQRTWIGTENGLYICSPENPVLKSYIPYLPDNSNLDVHSVFIDGDSLFIGSQRSLLKYRIDSPSGPDFMHPENEFISGEKIEGIFKDSRKRLWLVGESNLYRLKSNKLVPVLETPLASPSLAIRPIRPIIEDRTGIIWFGTFGSGIFQIDTKGNITNLQHDPANPASLSDNTINSLYEDRSGGIWVGTFGAGISIFDPYSNLIKTLRHSAFDAQSLSSSFVWSVFETQDGRIWVGTNTSGITIVDPVHETYQYLVHDPLKPGSLPEGAVREIFQSRKGTIWIGTDGGGLSKYIPAQNTFYSYRCNPDDPASMSSNSVRTIYEDSTGILWIGTRQGLNRFDPNTGKFKRYLHDAGDSRSISNNFVYSAIYMDKRGYLWVGTYGGGLNRLDTRTGRFISYQFDPGDPSSISDDIVFSLYEDEKGYFWIGTNSGLNLFNPATGKFKRYGLESGLPNEVIYGIMPDNDNNLWLTTNKGISRLDLTEFQFKNLDVRDGLQSNEFNGGAFHRGKSGLIYAGGVYGLSIIDPKKIVPVINQAELIISRLEILGKDVQVLSEGMMMDPDLDMGDNKLVEMVRNYYLPKHVTYLDEIRLNYKQRFFSIEFAALNNHLPEKLNYRYRMQNLEEHWNIAGNRNYVTYANMKPGSYVFEVDASNADGFLTGKPARLKIIISPPFWRSYYFMLLMALLAAGIVVFIYRFLLNKRTNTLLKDQNEKIRLANNQLQVSENNLKELNATKDKFFSIISHDLKNPFASVLSISELIDTNFDATNTEELRYGVRKIHSTNKHIYELLENLLTWSRTQRGSIKLEKVRFNLSKIIETNINVLKLAAEKKNVEVRNNVNADLFALGDREMISTAFRNLLNNALKFTAAGKKIYIESEADPHFVRVLVKDEGIGISEENLNRLFRIDVKFKTPGTDGETGTGLGLLICKEFVEKNGGSISVESAPGKGSTFSFTVPAGME